jgi:hypothetical protein
MTISKLLGATMVTGALAAGGAVAGIAGAAAAPGASSATTTGSSAGTTTTSPSTSATPATPAPQRKSGALKAGAQGKDPCPNMGGSGSNGRSGSGYGSDAGDPAPSAGVTYE